MHRSCQCSDISTAQNRTWHRLAAITGPDFSGSHGFHCWKEAVAEVPATLGKELTLQSKQKRSQTPPLSPTIY